MMYLKLRYMGTGQYPLVDVGVFIDPDPGSDFPDVALMRQLAESAALRALVLAGTVEVDAGAGWLTAANGLKHLELIHLMAGNDTAPQFTHIEGQITDYQHGARGAGTLHPDATPSVAGFMSPTDKGKLDGIGNGGMPRTVFTFGDQSGSGITKTGTGYAARRYFRFPGTTAIGRTTGFSCYIIAFRTSGTNSCSVRLYNETNGQVIAEQTGIVAVTRTIYTPTVSNLPAGQALFRIDLDGGSGSAVNCDHLEIN
jgi:hypothetical protein